MKNFTNIARTDEKPYYVDAQSITAVTFNEEKKEFALYNGEGRLCWLNSESFDIDPRQALQKLAQAGNALVSFPSRYEDKEYPHYVAPSALTFATVTEPDKDGLLGVIAGIRGFGRLESYGTKPAELAALLDGARAGGRQLLEYAPETAHARWYNAQALYIDPASVTEIREDGSQVNVYFAGSGSLDVQTRLYDNKDNERLNDALNKLWQERGADPKDMGYCFMEAQRLEKERIEKARLDFADGLGAATSLTKIPAATRVTYVRPEEFSHASFYDDTRADAGDYKYSLSLNRSDNGQRSFDSSVRVYFNSAAKRAEAFAALTAPPAKHTGFKPPEPG